MEPDIAKAYAFATPKANKSFGQAFSKACGVQGQRPAIFPKRVFEGGVRGETFPKKRKFHPSSRLLHFFHLICRSQCVHDFVQIAI
ncbi:MAG: hypothetical protein J6I95_04090, partial [Anaerotignum sp.]|nr:hypothetical protein [Anaerotignum sp.]